MTRDQGHLARAQWLALLTFCAIVSGAVLSVDVAAQAPSPPARETTPEPVPTQAPEPKQEPTTTPPSEATTSEFVPREGGTNGGTSIPGGILLVLVGVLVIGGVTWLMRSKGSSTPERIVEPSAPETHAGASASAGRSETERPPHAAPSASPSGAAPAAASVHPKIFISYRRDDSADVTGRIYEKLADRFGAPQVFKDVDSIPFGVDFRDHLRQQVEECDIVLVIIGDRWLSAGGGERRLDDQRDFVRIELEAALQRKIPVVPVLVRGAAVPAESALPPSLGPLAYRNGIAVRPDPDFRRDIDRLIDGIVGHATKSATA